MCPCLYPGDVDLSTSSCATLATVTAGPRIRVVRFFRSLRTLVFSNLGGVVVTGLLHLEKPLFVALCCRWHGTKTHYRITHIVTVYIPDYNIQTNSPRIRELKKKQWWHQRCASHGNRPGSLGFVAVGPEDCQHAEVLVLGDVAAGIDYVAGLQKLQVWLLFSLSALYVFRKYLSLYPSRYLVNT